MNAFGGLAWGIDSNNSSSALATESESSVRAYLGFFFKDGSPGCEVLGENIDSPRWRRCSPRHSKFQKVKVYLAIWQ